MTEGYRQGPEPSFTCNGCFFLESKTTYDSDGDAYNQYKCSKLKKNLNCRSRPLYTGGSSIVETAKECPFIPDIMKGLGYWK